MEIQDYKKNSYLSTAIFAFVVSFVASQLLLALGNSLLATIAKYAELPIEQVSSSLWSLAFLNIINQGTFFGVFWFVYKRNKPVFSTNIFSRPHWLILIICLVTGVASLLCSIYTRAFACCMRRVAFPWSDIQLPTHQISHFRYHYECGHVRHIPYVRIPVCLPYHIRHFAWSNYEQMGQYLVLYHHSLCQQCLCNSEQLSLS